MSVVYCVNAITEMTNIGNMNARSVIFLLTNMKNRKNIHPAAILTNEAINNDISTIRSDFFIKKRLVMSPMKNYIHEISCSGYVKVTDKTGLYHVLSPCDIILLPEKIPVLVKKIPVVPDRTHIPFQSSS